jgi:glucose-6-phosphate 1-dehydrogenase
MFQMLAYLCMEVPGSFAPDAIRNEKAKLLQSVRVYTRDDVKRYVVRGQYGPSADGVGQAVKPGYREEKDVNPKSNTETYAAARLHIDNWRWEGVPIYLRSGKALWKRGTELIVEFKKAPEVLFRGTPVPALGANRLIFHIQPYQGIEIQFQAKIPGPRLNLQPVNMRFAYGDAFKASRYTGYEVMIYSCSHGDATLFSRGADLVAKDGRRWHEIVNEEVLKKVPLFKDGDMLFLEQVIMALRSAQVEAGDYVIRKGEMGRELYVLARGEVEVLDEQGNTIKVLSDGDIFGEIGVLLSRPRNADIRAKTSCDLFVLDKADFSRILRDNPQFASAVQQVAKERYSVNVAMPALIGPPPQ